MSKKKQIGCLYPVGKISFKDVTLEHQRCEIRPMDEDDLEIMKIITPDRTTYNYLYVKSVILTPKSKK